MEIALTFCLVNALRNHDDQNYPAVSYITEISAKVDLSCNGPNGTQLVISLTCCQVLGLSGSFGPKPSSQYSYLSPSVCILNKYDNSNDTDSSHSLNTYSILSTMLTTFPTLPHLTITQIL